MQKNTVETLFINWGESFVEVGSTKSDGQILFQRHFLPRTPLKKILSNFSQVERIVMSTKLANTILHKKIGASPAYLVTSGFEGWLDINRPVQEKYFTLQPTQLNSLTTSDLIFSIQERTDANGLSVKPLKIDELKFLHEKLKLHNIKTICINFLHSHKFPENELLASKYFEENGYKIFSSHFTSHLKSSNANSSQERPRWLAALINSYIYPTWTDELISFKEALKESGHGEKVVIDLVQNDGSLKSWENSFPLDTLFATEFLTSQLTTANGKADSQPVCYLGLENFQILKSSQAFKQIWSSDHGHVQTPSVEFSNSSIQPTSSIEESFWKSPQITNKLVGYEPGPMCLGKSSKATLLDVFYMKNGLKNIAGLSEILAEKSILRIQDSLFSYNKNSRNVDDIFSVATKILASQIALLDRNFISLVGALAPTLEQELKVILPSKKILRHQNWEYPILANLIGEYTT